MNLAGATVIDNGLVGTTRRGRIQSWDADTLSVTVLWANGSYNQLRPADIRSGRYTVEVTQ